jgi:hypothetical protein
VSDTHTSTSDPAFGFVAVVAILLGVSIVGYGLVVVPQSALGGVWIAASGLALVVSGAVGSRWASDRWAFSPATRRRWSLACAILSVFLLGSFVVVNGATFESGTAESTSSIWWLAH